MKRKKKGKAKENGRKTRRKQKGNQRKRKAKGKEKRKGGKERGRWSICGLGLVFEQMGITKVSHQGVLRISPLQMWPFIQW